MPKVIGRGTGRVISGDSLVIIPVSAPLAAR